MKKILFFASSLVIFAQPLVASEADFLSCATVASRGERLDCYDRVAQRRLAELSKAEQEKAEAQAKAVPVVPVAPTSEPPAVAAAKPSVPPTKPETSVAETAFGAEHLIAREESKRLGQLEVKIAKVDYRPRGQYLLTMENGQVWSENEKSRLRLKIGDTVTIKRASFGSYTMSEGNGPATRVKRVK